MWGAIIGDLAGSIYEYEQVKSIKQVKHTLEVLKNLNTKDLELNIAAYYCMI